MARKSKNPPTKEQIDAIQKAVKIAGGQGQLAKAIEASPSSVSNWCAGLTGVGNINAKKIEDFTEKQVMAYELSSRLKKQKEKADKDTLLMYR